jgi:DNA-binding PadR family transcriptional regulator
MVAGRNDQAVGFLTYRERPGKKGQTRKIYRLSANGRKELKKWVDEASGDAQVRDEQMVKFCVSTDCLVSESLSIFSGSEKITPQNSSITKSRWNDLANIDLKKSGCDRFSPYTAASLPQKLTCSGAMTPYHSCAQTAHKH